MIVAVSGLLARGATLSRAHRALAPRAAPRLPHKAIAGCARQTEEGRRRYQRLDVPPVGLLQGPHRGADARGAHRN
jgi:hypothetical protein